MKANDLRMALALAAVGALALTPAAGVGGKDEFDPRFADRRPDVRPCFRS
jgi:hypothetical protein